MDDSKVTPREDVLYVEKLGGWEERSESDLLVVRDREELEVGSVLATGPGRSYDRGAGRVPMQVQKGDTVLFGRYAGTEVGDIRDKRLFLREGEVHAVVMSP